MGSEKIKSLRLPLTVIILWLLIIGHAVWGTVDPLLLIQETRETVTYDRFFVLNPILSDLIILCRLGLT